MPGTAKRVQQWFDDIANYKVLQTNGEDGWEMARRPIRRCIG